MKRLPLFLLIAVFMATGCSMENEKESKREVTEDMVLVSEGVKALKNKDPLGAVQQFEKALAINPENAAAYVLAGNIYLRAHRNGDVVRVLAPGLKHVPNNGTIPYMMAVALKDAGHPKRAYLVAKRAEEIYDAWQQTEALKQTRLLISQLTRDIKNENENDGK